MVSAMVRVRVSINLRAMATVSIIVRAHPRSRVMV
jgi:hypothetical protein